MSNQDEQFFQILQSTRTTFRSFASIHERLREKLPWYYRWHLNPVARFSHLVVLGLVISLSLAQVTSVLLSSPGVSHASGNTQAWPASQGWSAWTNNSNTSATITPGSLTLDQSQTWSRLSTPTQNSDTQFKSIWGTDASDIWAVRNDGLSVLPSAIYHYDGTSWSNSPGHNGDFNSIWGISSTDIWAVGNSGSTVHYDGASWSIKPTSGGHNLASVWGSSANDIWAVGENQTILHYFDDPSDGGLKWHPNTTLGGGTNYNLTTIWGTGPDDIWAGGKDGSSAAIIHYNGATWSVAKTLGTGSLAINTIWGISNEIWATTYDSGDATDHFYGSIDNSDWTEYPINGISSGESFKGVWGASTSDIWAVAQGNNNAARWNGASWNIVPDSNLSSGVALWGSSATDIWSVTGSSSAFSHYVSYLSPGTASINFDASVDSVWTSLTKSDSLVDGQTATYYAKSVSDNSACSSTDSWSGWSELSFSENVADLSGISHSQYLCLGVILTTSNPAIAPSLSSLSLNYDDYVAPTPVPTPTPGTVWAWGNNGFGELGNSTNDNSEIPVQASTLTNAVSVMSGANSSSSFALKNDGTVWAWGWNYFGQLCNGNTTNTNAPAQIDNLNDMVAVSGGDYHSLALKNDGTVWACGDNQFGQLGNNTNSPSTTPVQVQFADPTVITAIAAGQLSSLALKNDGTVWAWGIGQHGELGNGTNQNNSNTPVQVNDLTGITAIAAGQYDDFALKNDGTVWAWGNNDHGRLGDGSTTDRNTPVQVQFADPTVITAIAAGQLSSLALKNDGTVWAWGDNRNGELGNNTLTSSDTPVQVNSLSGVSALAGGQANSFALKNDGTVWAWGLNNVGQLGDGSTIDREVPVQISGLTSVTSLAAGINHGLAVSPMEPTPTNSPTPTATIAPTDSPTPTSAPTDTPTPAPGATPTPTPAPTTSPTSTPTPTPTASPTHTATPVVVSATNTPTPTSSPTPTPTVTSSVVASTATPTSTTSPTPSTCPTQTTSYNSGLVSVAHAADAPATQTLSKGQPLVLKGVVDPYSKVTIQIHSAVLTFHTVADSAGNWCITVPTTTLTPGAHHVDVSSVTPGGKSIPAKQILDFTLTGTPTSKGLLPAFNFDFFLRSLPYLIALIFFIIFMLLAIYRERKRLEAIRKKQQKISEGV